MEIITYMNYGLSCDKLAFKLLNEHKFLIQPRIIIIAIHYDRIMMFNFVKKNCHQHICICS